MKELANRSKEYKRGDENGEHQVPSMFQNHQAYSARQ